MKWKNFGLKGKMIALISLLILLVFLIFTIYLFRYLSDMVEEQTGQKALSLAHTVANIPEIQDAFELSNPASTIQKIITPIQEASGAEFIVVGNRDGIRYSHPNPDFIGKKMVGGDNKRAILNGESYQSKKEGTLGLSIRGKVPIKKDGEIIGVVSVGFLNGNIQEIIQDKSKPLFVALVLAILLGMAGAVLITNYIKRILFHMEPEQISQLYYQNKAILQSTHEGMIAVDHLGHITAVNKNAREIIGTDAEESEFIGREIRALLPVPQQITGLIRDQELILGETIILLNGVSLQGEQPGAVYTFRKKTELAGVVKELSRIKQYAHAQRAFTHEFSNKMHIILGLLQNNETQKAMSFIRKENHSQMTRLNFLTKRIADPLLQALLQGKYNQANEWGIEMTIHEESRMMISFSLERQNAILTALGNIIENALEAVRGQKNGVREVSIYFTDIGNDCVFEVQDSGTGIKDKLLEKIFDQGFTMKEGDYRGVGLAISKKMINDVDGEILVESGENSGTSFIIILPKKGEE
ncbi:sensor histidine kinase [Cytobacillus sp. FSL W7-1323]|uniref:sensor histidine kinase n=1 Tax=unclassified Cytobacillus TaxID=2675268 RepID=UPI0030F9F095